MTYVDVREKAIRIIERGWVLDGIKIDSGSTVTDGEKFINVHIKYLDLQRANNEKGITVKKTLVMPFLLRLNNYCEEVLRIKN